MLLKPIWKKDENACTNTEELLAAIRKINKEETEEDMIVGSLDVKALYPNLDIKKTAEVAAETFYESDFEVEGVDWRELGLYLALNSTKEQLEANDISQYCPKRKHNRGQPPTITGGAMNKKAEKRYEPWTFPNTPPDKDTTKKMLSEAIKIAIKYIMDKHVYEFDGTTRQQTKGGAIGLELTGELANIFMTWWDKELNKRLTQHGIQMKLYKRYVDDINIIFKAPSEQQSEETTTESPPKDQQYMNIIREIGNKIHPSIQLETDCPTLHSDNKLPILDVKVWVEKRKENEGPTTTKVIHEYYSKEVSTKAVINERSSLPLRTKRTILTMEALRIQLRCSPELPKKNVTEHLNEFTRKLQYSGYNQKFRGEIINSALQKYKHIKDLDEKGKQPLYRPKEWNREEREKSRRRKKGNWFKKGGDENVLFIPATPKSELRKRYEQTIKETNIKIKVVERAGRTLKSLLQKSNPFKSDTCKNKEECMLCNNNGKGQCRRDNVTYEVQCNECKQPYIGETARNAYSRGLEHNKALIKSDKNSVLHRHATETHEGRNPGYTMSVTGHHDSALTRQLTEAVKINNHSGPMINNKQEWLHPCLPRAVLTVD